MFLCKKTLSLKTQVIPSLWSRIQLLYNCVLKKGYTFFFIQLWWKGAYEVGVTLMVKIHVMGRGFAQPHNTWAAMRQILCWGVLHHHQIYMVKSLHRQNFYKIYLLVYSIKLYTEKWQSAIISKDKLIWNTAKELQMCTALSSLPQSTLPQITVKD